MNSRCASELGCGSADRHNALRTIPVGHQPIAKHVDVKVGFQEQVPLLSAYIAAFPASFSGPLCHIGSQRSFP
jgi:hypothetical protein